MDQRIFNRPEYTGRRQKLRTNATFPESCLWQAIRNKALGVKFRRQHGIGHYITDFYCPEIKLAIELDGDSHFTIQAQADDQVRDDYFRSCGIEVLRFNNHEVMHNLSGVCERLAQVIALKQRVLESD